MFEYTQFLQNRIDELKSLGEYRFFQTLERKECLQPFSHSHGKHVTNWCNNDYLCLSKHPKVVQAFTESAQLYGVGAGGTRSISGTSLAITELETTLADFHQTQSALVSTSGYVINVATLGALCKHLPGLHIFSDALNHASIIAGLQKGKTIVKHIFAHNNVKQLEQMLSLCPADAPKMIVVESVYSMEGTLSPLPIIDHLARKYNALLYVDEVHSIGIYGKNGKGLCNHHGVTPDILQANLSKGLGCLGGYICATNVICDFVRCFASEFIFTTALPPAIAHAAIQAIELVKSMDQDRQRLFQITHAIRVALRRIGWHIVGDDKSHMVPVLLGDVCKDVSAYLLNEHSIYVQPICHPTVKRGQERLRITPTHTHNDAMIKHLIFAMTKAFALYKPRYNHTA